MNDHELLELAAKAAGYQHRFDDGTHYIKGQTLWLIWTPHDDDDDDVHHLLAMFEKVRGEEIDDDALRLAVTMFRDLHFWYYDNSVSVGNEMRVLCGEDPYAATRRAIVRAAAEIGKGVK